MTGCRQQRWSPASVRECLPPASPRAGCISVPRRRSRWRGTWTVSRGRRPTTSNRSAPQSIRVRSMTPIRPPNRSVLFGLPAAVVVQRCAAVILGTRQRSAVGGGARRGVAGDVGRPDRCDAGAVKQASVARTGRIRVPIDRRSMSRTGHRRTDSGRAGSHDAPEFGSTAVELRGGRRPAWSARRSRGW